MAQAQYKTGPNHDLKGFPPGIKYIVGNEGCERFSYYGMNAILYVYCVMLYKNALITDDNAADMATSTVHLFKTGVYAFPMIGAVIADRLLGKYNTILYLSLVYCFGHVVLSLTEGTVLGLNMGLLLIALGSGGIKPCVSAHVGDQFGRSNWRLLERVYQIFYFMINVGSFLAVWFIPLIKEKFGFRIAFLIPGILMFLATYLFYMGRNDFVHIPAKPAGRLGFLDASSSALLFLTIGSLFFTAHASVYVMVSVSLLCLVSGMALFLYRQSLEQDDGFLAVVIYIMREWALGFVRKPETIAVSVGSGGNSGLSGVHLATNKFGEEAVEGVKAVFRIMGVFIMVSFFWALFDQHASSWIRQATLMNRDVSLPLIGSFTLLPSQIPSLNPVMVMILIPFWAYVVDPALRRVGIAITPLKKMSLGMALASTSFIAVALIQSKIESVGTNQVHVFWQLIPYFLITLSEVLVSITGLEFAYSQAPRRMKSTVMGFWLLTVALGNVMVSLLARFSNLELTEFFYLFAFLMGVAAIIFSITASFYKVRDYVQ